MEIGQGKRPVVIGIGGTTRAGSSSEMLLRAALREIELLGAETKLFAGPDLVFPIFTPEKSDRHPGAVRLVEGLRTCDGIVISSPGYHGSMSGLIKNALDYTEDMVADPSPYLDSRPVGCKVCAHGWQATGSTLAALRSVLHALRAWPTPLGIAVNSATEMLDDTGVFSDKGLSANLKIMAYQIMVRARQGADQSAEPEC